MNATVRGSECNNEKQIMTKQHKMHDDALVNMANAKPCAP
jgi:hypothetical protein